ncbi:MAG: HEAT repeat domain-containing protein, partial [Phycisphaerae bacterium]|nr:HEAT repeat domain-containing protein [Phycisphaerae bacterium]
RENMCKAPGNPLDLHELGWQQRPVHIAAAAAEALGRIGTADAQAALIEAMPQLLDFWQYTLWCGDHSWLMGCHSSVLHHRILEAFDAMETGVPLAVVQGALKAVPIDTDRGLIFENDAYESLTARVVNRSGFADEVVEACLAVLGDCSYTAGDAWKLAVTASPPAVSVLPHDPESRAAEILSVVCMDPAYLGAVRKVFNRYRQTAPSRPRSWVCFYLARLMGRMKDADAVPLLMACLTDDATEASFGFESQPNVFIYKAMTPFYRAAAADALGRIGQIAAVDTLFAVVEDFDNGMSVRHAAARSLAMLCGSEHRNRLEQLAQDYPEVSIRRALLEACAQARSREMAVAR